MKQKLPFADIGEYWRSMTEVLRVIPFHPLISFDAESLSVSGEVFWLLIPDLSIESF
jgi:hypothetical protein